MTTVSNPKFDQRMTSIPQLGLVKSASAKYYRGAILRDNGSNTILNSGKGTNYRVDFLFNPTTITISHDAGTMLTADQRSTNGKYVSAVGIGQVQFNLLFDRTYELSASSMGNLGGSFSRGVLDDVEALYRVTGVYDTTAKGASATVINPMQSYTCYFFFGDYLSAGNALSYYGYISTMSINYTHFTNSMIPQRCGVTLQVELQQKG